MNKLNEKKILVIGSGGRENAICEAFKNSLQPTQLFALPGNAGTKKIAENIENINISDFPTIINFCQINQTNDRKALLYLNIRRLFV
jgi:phosphoribosylamine--glycine ligase